MIELGDDLGNLVVSSLAVNSIQLLDGDIIILGQKVVSKAEGRMVNLANITPSAKARQLGKQTGKDPRLVELVLSESQTVLRACPGTIIVEHRLGFICANAGIDHSNVTAQSLDGEEFVLLLPKDPDRSASAIRTTLEKHSGKRLGVLINDSHGRAWRLGTIGVSIGMSGIPPLIDERGWSDLFGYTLRSTIVGVGDELAAAGSLVMGQAGEGTPVIHARGFPYPLDEGKVKDLVRPKEQDLFR